MIAGFRTTNQPYSKQPVDFAVSRQVAGQFKQETAEEEDPGAYPVNERGDPQILVHRERGEPDVDSIDLSDQIQQHQVGHEPRGNLFECLSANSIGLR